jgi:hypothetical protein
MKIHRSARLLTLLALVALFLAACQPAALETTSPLVELDGTATQPLEADTEGPAPIPTDSEVVTETAAPDEPTEVLLTAAPTGEGTGLPPTGMQVPEGWQVLNDSTQRYSLAYPTDWKIGQETKYSRVFSQIQKEPAWMEGTALRLYVSAVPQDYTNQEFEVYNFYPIESIREFMAIPVGDSKLKVPGSSLPDYFTYTRLPDRIVAGWNALVIENPKVWEAPSGTKDRVVFIVTESTTYILGMYYDTPEQLAMFEQVLDSFQFVP